MRVGLSKRKLEKMKICKFCVRPVFTVRFVVTRVSPVRPAVLLLNLEKKASTNKLYIYFLCQICIEYDHYFILL